MKCEEMFQPIDLESSLGRIDDDTKNESNDMDCEPVTNTSEQSPFQKGYTDETHDQRNFAPYPIAETHAEVKERQRLSESVGKFLPPHTTFQSPVRQVDWVPEDLELVEHPGEDEFSLTSAEEESLVEENLEFEKIDDPVSFWDSGVQQSSNQPNMIPSTVSYSSHAGESLI